MAVATTGTQSNQALRLEALDRALSHHSARLHKGKNSTTEDVLATAAKFEDYIRGLKEASEG